MATPESDQPATIYQLEITLDNSDPPIWRRVQIEDCDLTTLHQVIQSAMGWEDDHMHEFEIGKKKYVGNPIAGDPRGRHREDDATERNRRARDSRRSSTGTTSATTGFTRSGSRNRFRRSRAYIIPAASKASEPAHPRIAAASGGITGSWTR